MPTVVGHDENDNGVRGSSDNNDGIFGITNRAGKSGVFGDSTASLGEVGFGVSGTTNASRGAGVNGFSPTGVGVRGTSEENDGVVGSHLQSQPGVVTGPKSGVFGENTQPRGDFFGVSGTTYSPEGAGVNGFSDEGVGVKGHSKRNDGIVGSSAFQGKSGVFGFNTKPTGAAFGVSGTTDSPDGAGVLGFSDQGYGGNFRGGRAPLRLEPANTAGRPTTGDHQRGELFVDSTGELFYCKVGGTPGTWFKVNLTRA
jgi:hypothetical protein